MANDGYRNGPDQQPFFDYSDPRVQYPVVYNKPKSRQSSRDRGDVKMPEQTRYPQSHHQHPINEAVSSAVGKEDPSSSLNPELIAQITENVIRQLRTTTMDASTPIQPIHSQYPPPPSHQPVPLSPSTQSGASPPMPTRNVYTPPSPHKHYDYPSHGSPENHSTTYAAPPSPKEPSMPQFEDRRPSSRLSSVSDPNAGRPRGPARLSTSNQETLSEKVWGQLFDEEGHSTVRLGQFLRGLAIHIIEDYEPRHSLVITPKKMVQYYEDFKLPNELYPWSDVFDDEHSSISRMFRDLECQHHLVQERHDLRPDIPGLTPIGFERWATLLIQSHPDQEYERLQKSVMMMPINNPDDKKERFPKELTRRLFPNSEHGKIRERLEKAIAEHAGVKLPKHGNVEMPKANFTEPPLRRVETNLEAEPAYIPSNIERERKPYSSIPSESAIDDTNPAPSLPQPIERERKPYCVAPGGGGKLYEEDSRNMLPNPPSHPGRSNSTTERIRPIPSYAPKPTGDTPQPEFHHQHRNSISHRRRASPAGSDFRRSDTDLRSFQPASYQPVNIPNNEIYEDERRHGPDGNIRRAEYARRQADDDASGYGGSPSGRTRYDSRLDNDSRRGTYGSEEDYYRGVGKSQGSGYEYSQSYGGPGYR